MRYMEPFIDVTTLFLILNASKLRAEIREQVVERSGTRTKTDRTLYAPAIHQRAGALTSTSGA